MSAMKPLTVAAQKALAARVWMDWRGPLRALGVKALEADGDQISTRSGEGASLLMFFRLDEGPAYPLPVHLLYLGQVETAEQLADWVKAVAAVEGGG